MFERFTEGARQVVVLSQEESRLLGHMHIGTEHLLLGLVRQEDEAVVAVLSAHELSLERAREDVVALVARGTENLSGQIPFTPRAKKVLELSLVKAKELEHNVITPLHLMLGLALEQDGLAARILLDHGLDAETVERELSEQDPYRLGSDVYARRLAQVEAQLLAWEHRAGVIEIAATSDDHEAEPEVADRLGITRELARDVLNMRLQHFSPQHVRGLQQERDALRRKLGQSG